LLYLQTFRGLGGIWKRTLSQCSSSDTSVTKPL
jgi:hypothetical protein